MQNGTAVPSWFCLQAVSKPVWHTPLLCVQWKTPDDGQRNCPNPVEFYSKNKFEKLVHLGGHIIRRKYIEQNIITLRASKFLSFCCWGLNSSATLSRVERQTAADVLRDCGALCRIKCSWTVLLGHEDETTKVDNLHQAIFCNLNPLNT